MSLPTEEIGFIRSDSFCVSFVKMAEPMDIEGNSHLANSDKARRYYSIFLNTIAGIAQGFDAKIIKNVGDGLVCYFPKTSGCINDSTFNDVIGFGVTAMAARYTINKRLHEEKISAAVNYTISVDYGRVEVAETVSSGGKEDLFGSPMNLCAKINAKAPINGMIIGHNLYQILKGPYFWIHCLSVIVSIMISSK